MRSIRLSYFISILLLFVGIAPVGANDLPWSAQAPPNSGNILLLSDLHFDPFADTQIAKKLLTTPLEQWDGLLAPGMKGPFAAPGKDSNYALLVSALTAAQQRGPYDMAIVTGDFLVHDSRALFEAIGGKNPYSYEDFIIKVEVFVVREVQKSLPGTPVYFALGNNDSECGDYMMATKSRFLDAFEDELHVLDKATEAHQTAEYAGYYAVPHPVLPHTELIVLNDIFWSNRFSLDSCHPQPNEKAGLKEMDWLKDQLAKARKEQQKVWLVMHIPPQVDIFGTTKALTMGGKKKGIQLFWDDQFESAYVRLMRQYSDVVAIAFAGHTHMDDFRVMNDAQGKPFLVTHICPAVSPIRFNNPAFQVLEYDKTSGAIQDQATYYLKNLTTAQAATDGDWELEYDFDQTYGVDGYNAASLAALTRTLDSDKDKMAKFVQYYPISAQTVISTEDWTWLNDLRLLSDNAELKKALIK